jgi:DNA (cytosine-5)-methyltransferase 1
LAQQHLFSPAGPRGSTKRPLRGVDLFAGVGGLSLGFEAAGFQIAAAFENDPAALKTFRANHNGTPAHALDLSSPQAAQRIAELVDGPIDVVLGGPPCQGFSLTGPRRLEDSRNDLYMAVAKTVERLQPKAFLVENVPGMRGLYRGEVLREVLQHFRGLGEGYHVWSDVLIAADFGVPQMRKRLFIVGLRSDVGSVFVAPEATLQPDRYIGCRNAIGDLPTRCDSLGEEEDQYDAAPFSSYQEEMRKDSVALWNHVATNHTELVRSVIAMVPEGGNHKDLPKGVGESRRFNEAWTRYHGDRPSKTIDTGHRNHFHYALNRVPTIRENARLQSFPDHFRFVGTRTSQNRQVGNAVPPRLAEALARQIGAHLT